MRPSGIGQPRNRVPGRGAAWQAAADGGRATLCCAAHALLCQPASLVHAGPQSKQPSHPTHPTRTGRPTGAAGKRATYVGAGRRQAPQSCPTGSPSKRRRQLSCITPSWHTHVHCCQPNHCCQPLPPCAHLGLHPLHGILLPGLGRPLPLGHICKYKCVAGKRVLTREWQASERGQVSKDERVGASE